MLGYRSIETLAQAVRDETRRLTVQRYRCCWWRFDFFPSLSHRSRIANSSILLAIEIRSYRSYLSGTHPRTL